MPRGSKEYYGESSPDSGAVGDYLRKRVREANGCVRVHSRHLAAAFETTPKFMATRIRHLRENDDELHIEKWGGSNSPWEVTFQ